MWVGISLWFWFAFPWWLVMSSIFLCSCWPSVCLLWKNVYSSPLFIFVVVDVVDNWVEWVLYIFWISTPYWIYHLQIRLPFSWLPFHFVDDFLHCAKLFTVWCSPICLFLLLLSLPEETYSKKNIAKTSVKEVTAYVFF